MSDYATLLEMRARPDAAFAINRLASHRSHTGALRTHHQTNHTHKRQTQPDWSQLQITIHKVLQMLDDLGCCDQVRKHDVPINSITGRKFQII